MPAYYLIRLNRVAKSLSVALLVLTMGLHWAFLQSVAWVGMVVTYAQHDSIPAAFSKTFDGKHPCSLCKVVAKGQQSEKTQAPVSLLKKMGLTGSVLASTSFEVPEAPAESRLRLIDLSAASRPYAPPSPPPRFA